ncbi:hypothetical protein [Terribacillus sp. 7520-G]|uniref:hypothetical protein n=1 Tax=Terribacillus TaxID=459532 RepID=UPI00117FA5FA|nr:hypothetical protein [Terribacillus sp. 7520-G]
MTIKITRKKNFYGGLDRIKLYVNDQMLTKLRNGETYEFEPNSNLVHIRTSVQGIWNSDKMKVKDGSSITIKVNPLIKNLHLISLPALTCGICISYHFFLITFILLFAMSLLADGKSHILSVDND